MHRGWQVGQEAPRQGEGLRLGLHGIIDAAGPALDLPAAEFLLLQRLAQPRDHRRPGDEHRRGFRHHRVMRRRQPCRAEPGDGPEPERHHRHQAHIRRRLVVQLGAAENRAQRDKGAVGIPPGSVDTRLLPARPSVTGRPTPGAPAGRPTSADAFRARRDSRAPPPAGTSVREHLEHQRHRHGPRAVGDEHQQTFAVDGRHARPSATMRRTSASEGSGGIPLPGDHHAGSATRR